MAVPAAEHAATLALLTSEMGRLRNAPAPARTGPADRAPEPTDIDLRHIARGEVKTNWLKKGGQWIKIRTAKGYHLERSTEHARVVRGTKSSPDKNGVYTAGVEIRDPESGRWIAKKDGSTFFPESYSEIDVKRSIEEAYANAVTLDERMYEGRSSRGLVIQMFIDEPGAVTSAWPVKE
jgi:hypothetical protein